MTTSPSSAAASRSSSNGESLSSLPRWRQFLSMLNWRRDPGYEQRVMHYEQRVMHYEQRKMQHELRMKQLESEIEQIEKETELLRRENAKLRLQNAKGRQLLASIDALCFPPESSSIPASATEPASNPSSP
jgi:hypothetical protein